MYSCHWKYYSSIVSENRRILTSSQLQTIYLCKPVVRKILGMHRRDYNHASGITTHLYMVKLILNKSCIFLMLQYTVTILGVFVVESKLQADYTYWEGEGMERKRGRKGRDSKSGNAYICILYYCSHISY